MEGSDSGFDSEGEVENIVRVLDVSIVNPNSRKKELVITLVAVDWKEDEDDAGTLLQWDAEWKLPEDISNLNHLEADCRSSKYSRAGRYSALDEFIFSTSGGRFVHNTAPESLQFFKCGDELTNSTITGFDRCFEAAQEIARARLEVYMNDDVGETPAWQKKARKRKLTYVDFVVRDDFEGFEENLSNGNMEEVEKVVVPEESTLTTPLPSFGQVLNQHVALAVDSIPLKELQRLRLQHFVEDSVLPLVQGVKYSTLKDAFDLVPAELDPVKKKAELAYFDIKMICTLCQSKVKINRSPTCLQWDLRANDWIELEEVQIWTYSAERHAKSSSCKAPADQRTPRTSSRTHSSEFQTPTSNPLVSENSDVGSFTTPVAGSTSPSKYDSGHVFSVFDLLNEEPDGHKLVEMLKR
jgi:hypothetical protein